MNKTGIWFMQGYANIYNAISDIRAADVLGQYKLICSHQHSEFVGGEAADVRLVEPSGKDAAFWTFIKDTVTKHNVRVILPSFTSHQKFLNGRRAELEAMGCRVATVADNATLDLINDKAALYNFLADKNIVRIPAFRAVETVVEFDMAYAELKPQFETICFKPTVGVYGSGFRILKETPNTVKDIIKESPHLNVGDLRNLMGDESFGTLMVMQFLEGDERSVDCLAVDGELVEGVIRRKSDSAVAGQYIEENPELMRQVQTLVSVLKLNGMFNVQFRDSDGEHFLLEINTRLSGRSYYATLAGFNIPFQAAQVFSGTKTVPQLEYRMSSGMSIGNVRSGLVLTPRVKSSKREAS